MISVNTTEQQPREEAIFTKVRRCIFRHGADRFTRKSGMRQCGHTAKLYQTGKTPKTARGARRTAAAPDGSVQQAAAAVAADDADGRQPGPGPDLTLWRKVAYFVAQS